MRYRELGLIGRFQPPHKGHESLLLAAARTADHLRIGIGSVNRHDAQRPFWPHEVEEMLGLILHSTRTPYRTLRVPDYGHLPGCEDGTCWRRRVEREFAGVDALVTGNPYVEQLLSGSFAIVTPDALLDGSPRHPICGTLVRSSIALGYGWEDLVPTSVGMYLRNFRIDERVRAEFGDELRGGFPREPETIDDEVRKVTGVTRAARGAEDINSPDARRTHA